jgi:hypothetical protein
MAKPKPPTKPSMVFLGDTFSKSLRYQIGVKLIVWQF